MGLIKLIHHIIYQIDNLVAPMLSHLRISAVRHNHRLLSTFYAHKISKISGKQAEIYQMPDKNNYKKGQYHRQSLKKLMMAAGIVFSLGFFTLQKVILTQNQLSQQNKIQQESRIVYLEDPQQVHNLNLQGNILIWYQCTDNLIIDTQVIQILKKFVQARDFTISSPYKIVIDKTSTQQQKINQTDDNNASNYYKKSSQVVIVKPDSIKPIELSKYLNFKGQKIDSNQYTNLFNRLAVQVNQFLEINKNNVEQFIQNLGTKQSEAWVLMAASNDSSKFQRKSKKNFRQFIKSKQAFRSHVQKAIITDQQTLQLLGLKNIQKNSEVVILAPSSENTPPNCQLTVINGKKYHILPSQLAPKMIFPPFLQKSHSDSLYLRVTVDANQNIAEQMKMLYKQLKELPEESDFRSLPKYLSYQKDNSENGSAIALTLQKNNFDAIVGVYEVGNRYTNAQKTKLIKDSHKWKYQPENSEIQINSLISWYERVKSGKQNEFYQSQNKVTETSDVPINKFYSKRITGQSYYHQISTTPQKPKIVFHFSPHCVSCKKFKHIYEQLAKQKQGDYDFYRINNDENKSPSIQNYNSTPIFVVYKRQQTDDKLFAFTYKNTIFTKQVFWNFLQTTNKLKIMDSQNFTRIIAEHDKNEKLIRELILDLNLGVTNSAECGSNTTPVNSQ